MKNIYTFKKIKIYEKFRNIKIVHAKSTKAFNILLYI